MRQDGLEQLKCIMRRIDATILDCGIYASTCFRVNNERSMPPAFSFFTLAVFCPDPGLPLSPCCFIGDAGNGPCSRRGRKIVEGGIDSLRRFAWPVLRGMAGSACEGAGGVVGVVGVAGGEEDELGIRVIA